MACMLTFRSSHSLCRKCQRLAPLLSCPRLILEAQPTDIISSGATPASWSSTSTSVLLLSETPSITKLSLLIPLLCRNPVSLNFNIPIETDSSGAPALWNEYEASVKSPSVCSVPHPGANSSNSPSNAKPWRKNYTPLNFQECKFGRADLNTQECKAGRV